MSQQQSLRDAVPDDWGDDHPLQSGRWADGGKNEIETLDYWDEDDVFCVTVWIDEDDGEYRLRLIDFRADETLEQAATRDGSEVPDLVADLVESSYDYL